jgi:hypothetical protein
LIAQARSAADFSLKVGGVFFLGAPPRPLTKKARNRRPVEQMEAWQREREKREAAEAIKERDRAALAKARRRVVR